MLETYLRRDVLKVVAAGNMKWQICERSGIRYELEYSSSGRSHPLLPFSYISICAIFLDCLDTDKSMNERIDFIKS